MIVIVIAIRVYPCVPTTKHTGSERCRKLQCFSKVCFRGWDSGVHSC